MSELLTLPTEIRSDGASDGMIEETTAWDGLNAAPPSSSVNHKEIDLQVERQLRTLSSSEQGDNNVVNPMKYVDDVPPLTSSDSDESDLDSDEDVDVINDRQNDPTARSSVESTASHESGIVTVAAVNQLKTALAEGGKASVSSDYKLAAVHYQKAVNLLAIHTEIELSNTQRAMLQFALGLVEINAESQMSVLDGLKHFQQLIDNFPKMFHVLGYFGIASGYCRQNRYVDGLQSVETALALVMEMEENVMRAESVDRVWPGTETVIEALQSADHLQDQLEDLLCHCRTPPLPDAVCRFSACEGHFKRQIYMTDLDFKGFVSVHCQEKCIVEFHVNCWRKLKTTEMEKRNDKEMLNTECITPDCKGLVCRIRFHGSDGGLIKEFPADLSDVETKPKKHASKAKQKGNLHGTKGAGHRKDKGQKSKTLQQAATAGDTASSGTGGGDEGSSGGKASIDRAIAADRAKDNGGEVVEMESVTALKGVNNNAAPAQNSFPLLPADGGNFVALQKKSLIDDVDDNYAAGGRQKKSKSKRDKAKPVTMHLDEFVDQLPNNSDSYDSFIGTGGFGSSTNIIGSQFDGFGIPQSFDQASACTSCYGDEELCAIPLSSSSYAMRTLASVISQDQPTSVARNSSSSLQLSQQQKAGSRSNITPSLATDNNDDDDDNESVGNSGPADADIKDNIFSLFASLLERNGPCNPDDPLIQRELEQFPTEAQLVLCQSGGISKFLQQSLQFAIVDGLICLTRDAAKARKLVADRRRMLLLGSLNPPGSGTLVAPSQQLKLNPPPFASAKSTGPLGGLIKATTGRAMAVTGLASVSMENSTHVSAAVVASQSASLMNQPTSCSSNSRSQSGSVSDLSVFKACQPPSHKSSSFVSSMLTKSQSNSLFTDTSAVMDDEMTFDSKSAAEPHWSWTNNFNKLLADPTSEATSETDAKSTSIMSHLSNYSEGKSSRYNSAVIEKSFKSTIDSSVGDMDWINAWKSQQEITAAGEKLSNSSSSSNSNSNKNIMSVKSVDASSLDEVYDSDDDSKVMRFCMGSAFALDSIDDGWRPMTSQSSWPTTQSNRPAGIDLETGPVDQNPSSSVTYDLEDIKLSDRPSKLSCKSKRVGAGPGVSHDLSAAVGHCNSDDEPAVNRSLIPASQLSATAHVFKPRSKTVATETDVNWNSELIELKNQKAAMETRLLIDHQLFQTELKKKDDQMHEMEKMYENEQRQYLTKWKNDRVALDRDMEKLMEELRIAKSTMEGQYQTVMVKEKLLHETKLALTKEEEKSRMLAMEVELLKEKSVSVTAERDKLLQLVGLMQASRDEEKASAMFAAAHPHVAAPPPRPAVMIQPAAATARFNLPHAPVMGARGPIPMMGQSVAPPLLQQSHLGLSAGTRLATPVPTVSSAASDTSSKSKQSFDKILRTLSTMFPHVKQTELTKCVQEVRAARGNSLSGLTMKQIVSLVKDMILKRELFAQRQLQKQSASVPPGLPTFMSLNYGPMAAAAAASSSQTIGGGYSNGAAAAGGSGPGSLAGDEEIFEEEENPCIVCHEELQSAPISKLDCGHIFHTDCIRKWFHEQKTCPTCRNFALLHDDFPTLGAAVASMSNYR